MSDSAKQSPLILPPDTDAELRREALLAELATWSDGFWRNEEAGERRLQFFITLLTAVAGGLVTYYEFLSKDRAPTAPSPDHQVIAVARPVLVGLLLLGTVTFMRLVRRHHVTDEYKERGHRIRQYIEGTELSTWLFPTGKRLEEFLRVHPRKPARGEGLRKAMSFLDVAGVRSVWNGGLSTTMLVLNCMVAALLFGIDAGPKLHTSRVVEAVIVAAAAQFAFQLWRDAVEKAKQDERD